MTGFADLFGGPPEIEATAPGRVNLIGEHTDYNGGFVLPIAIRRETRIAMRPRADHWVAAWSAEFPLPEPDRYRLGEERRLGTWLDYVQGVTWVLRQGGYSVPGFDVRIESTIPPGSGLSSSAALQVALLRGLSALAGLPDDPVRIARMAQRAESDFVGAPVGIMDQLAVLLGRRDAALFIDTRSLSWRFVTFPDAAGLLVIDSGIRHQLASGEYRQRREECARAAAALQVEQLRDLDCRALPVIEALPEPLAGAPVTS
jgi:galactokinase